MSLNKEIFVLDTSRGSLFFAVGNARLLFYHMGVAPLWIWNNRSALSQCALSQFRRAKDRDIL